MAVVITVKQRGAQSDPIRQILIPQVRSTPDHNSSVQSQKSNVEVPNLSVIVANEFYYISPGGRVFPESETSFPSRRCGTLP